VDWLDHGRTLREQGIDPDEMLLLRRKYFFSDQNVDARDPIQLNLLYVQVVQLNVLYVQVNIHSITLCITVVINKCYVNVFIIVLITIVINKVVISNTDSAVCTFFDAL